MQLARGRGRAATITLLLLACTARLGVTETHEKCEKLGFTGQSLCSDCKNLQEYVKDEALTEECLSCCVESATSGTKYKKAILEVCQSRLGNFPQLEEFIKRHADGIKGLKIKYNWGSPPRLTLKSGGKQETARIDAWKTEQMVEFLQDKLEAS